MLIVLRHDDNKQNKTKLQINNSIDNNKQLTIARDLDIAYRYNIN